MTTLVVVLVAIAVAVGVYFMFIAKKSPDQLEAAEEPRKLEAKPGQRGAERKTPKQEPEKKQEPERKLERKAEAKPEPAKVQESKTEPAKVEEKKAEALKAEEPKAEAKPVETKPAAEPEPAPVVGKPMAEPVETKHTRDVEALRKGLGKARAKEGFFGRLAKLITGHQEIDPAIVDELQEVLITSDVGVKTAEAMIERVRGELSRKELSDSGAVWKALREEARRVLDTGKGGLVLRTRPTVVLMVGVNGSGKTTTIGKLATQLKADGRKVVLAAGDTFRAAAVQQLEVWGKRVGCEVVKGKDGADPAAVIFDAIQKASASGADVVLADTAGRLHTKVPLMEELKKVARTMGKAMEGAPHETLLVLDSTNGQNAMAQARQFAEAMPLTGIVLTKLDGTAKGGVVLGIADELKLPVRYIGLGERADDLRPFDAEEFVEALLGDGQAEDQAA